MISGPFALADGVAYTALGYTKDEVRAAGEMYRLSDPKRPDRVVPTLDEFVTRREVLDNWRAAHTRPLIGLRVNLERYVAGVGPHHQAPLVAQRIKREESIVAKLRRIDWLHLDEMQDIGGARAVVSTVPQLRRLRDLHKQGRSHHTLLREDDYVDVRPKASGYRSIHLIYAFHCPGTSWHDLNVEIQLRTFLQHQWATASEVVGYGRGEKFKSGEGDPRWLRMFTLIGAAFAQLEKTKPISESSKTYGPVPQSLDELRPLIAELDQELRFRESASGYGAGFNLVQEAPALRNKYWFLLRLDLEKRQLTIRPYTRQDIKIAETDRATAERERSEGANLDVCLVSVRDMKKLRKAYPNYYLDTRQFLQRLDSILTDASASSASA